jgi:hypothetical protein
MQLVSSGFSFGVIGCGVGHFSLLCEFADVNERWAEIAGGHF